MTSPQSGGAPAITETSLSEGLMQNLKSCAKEAFEKLRLDPAAAPSDIITVVNQAVLKFQNEGGTAPSDPFDEDPLHFGSLWGEQLVATLGWEWTQFTFHEHGDSKAIGVVSSDRSLMICPFHFVFGCMLNSAPVTIGLSYNFLKNFDSPEVRTRMIGGPPQANAYVNVMDAVHHIVPPN